MSGAQHTDGMHIARIVSAQEVFSYGPSGGSWAEIDAPGHGGVALVVWRMEGDERTPACEARARRMAAADELLDELRVARAALADFAGLTAPHAHALARRFAATIAKAEGSAR